MQRQNHQDCCPKLLQESPHTNHNTVGRLAISLIGCRTHGGLIGILRRAMNGLGVIWAAVHCYQGGNCGGKEVRGFPCSRLPFILTCSHFKDVR